MLTALIIAAYSTGGGLIVALTVFHIIDHLTYIHS